MMLVATTICMACKAPEAPARVALRERLKQGTTLNDGEIAQVFDEVNRTIAGKTVRVNDGQATTDLTQDQRDVSLGILTNRAGVFDEGLRMDNGVSYRVFNAPAPSSNVEYIAERHLWVDVESFLPRKFQFTDEGAPATDYSLDFVFK